MKLRSAAPAFAAIVAFAAFAWAHEEHQRPAARRGSPELEAMKRLAGKWNGAMMGEGGKPEAATAEFKVTSAGSAVEETLGKGTPFEMVDMYVDQGGKLAMTHYCAIGNQPHMTLKSGGPKQIVLEMDATPGIDLAKDEHMHALTIEFPDDDHLIERWISYKNGQPGKPAVFKFSRVKKG